MSEPSNDVIIPKSMLIAAALLITFTMGVAGAARLTGANHVVMPPTYAVQSRDLAFRDLRDGGIDITDASNGNHVATVEPTTGGFLRGIMRGLVREHRLNDLAAGTSFRLTRWADGRLSIEDPATRERFELEAFGPTNEAAFARLLGPEAPQKPAGEKTAAAGSMGAVVR